MADGLCDMGGLVRALAALEAPGFTTGGDSDAIVLENALHSGDDWRLLLASLVGNITGRVGSPAPRRPAYRPIRAARRCPWAPICRPSARGWEWRAGRTRGWCRGQRRACSCSACSRRSRGWRRRPISHRSTGSAPALRSPACAGGPSPASVGSVRAPARGVPRRARGRLFAGMRAAAPGPGAAAAGGAAAGGAGRWAAGEGGRRQADAHPCSPGGVR